MKAENKARFDLLERVESSITSRLDFLENEFKRMVFIHLVNELVFDGDKIKSSNSNFLKLNKLRFFRSEFTKEKVNPLLHWMAKQYIKIAKANDKYFAATIPKSGKKAKKVRTDSLVKIGVQVIDKKVKVLEGGWLHMLGEFSDPYQAVNDLAQTAIGSEMKLKDFQKMIDQNISPEGKYGKIRHHFHTHARDTFSRYDRSVQMTYAEQLGLRAFIYQGGLINTSRDFCEKNNGKVFTLEEAEQWRDMNWQGKNDNYEPLRDMGGHNCRHFPSMISDKLAIRRRPELAERWGIKQKK